VRRAGLCTSQRSHMSTKPSATVYSGPSTADRKRVTLRTIRGKYLKGSKISMLTAYDYPSALHVRSCQGP
jgi:3-methyl-2-oxobutanoate hydroxymethyltransferase